VVIDKCHDVKSELRFS